MQGDPAKSVSVLRIFFFSNKQAWDKISACHLSQFAMIHSVIHSQFRGLAAGPGVPPAAATQPVVSPDLPKYIPPRCLCLQRCQPQPALEACDAEGSSQVLVSAGDTDLNMFRSGHRAMIHSVSQPLALRWGPACLKTLLHFTELPQAGLGPPPSANGLPASHNDSLINATRRHETLATANSPTVHAGPLVSSPL